MIKKAWNWVKNNRDIVLGVLGVLGISAIITIFLKVTDFISQNTIWLILPTYNWFYIIAGLLLLGALYILLKKCYCSRQYVEIATPDQHAFFSKTSFRVDLITKRIYCGTCDNEVEINNSEFHCPTCNSKYKTSYKDLKKYIISIAKKQFRQLKTRHS